MAHQVWCAVIEYGEDETPGVFVATSQDVARYGAALAVHAYALSRPGLYGSFVESVGVPTAETAAEWLEAWRELYTAAWVTLTLQPVEG